MIEVIRPGQFTSIQDLGRFGYRAIGVPVSGPMDSTSAASANDLLENEPNAPLIEMSFVGATFMFHESAVVAISGAMCAVKLNDAVIADQSILSIEAGSTLSFGAMTKGNFLYLAIRGGFECETTLGSACFYQAVTGQLRMEKGTRLHFDKSVQSTPLADRIKKSQAWKKNHIIEVEKGPEFDLLSAKDVYQVLETEFTISRQSNRMGFIMNEQLNVKAEEIISSPVQPGTVQLTKGGQLIVLMRDAQTIGGYSRVLQLTEDNVNQLAQMPLKTPFSFELINV